MSGTSVLFTLECDGKSFELESPTYFDSTGDQLDNDVSYQYIEGNYGCDCNRADFIMREYDDDALPDRLKPTDGVYPDIPCGETIRLTSLVIRGDGPDRSLDLFEEYANRLGAIGLVAP